MRIAPPKLTKKPTKRWEALMRDAFKDTYVVVGIPQGAGAYPEGGPSIAEVAVQNHYGTDRIPARPFISQPLDPNSDPVRRIMLKAAKGILAGKLDTYQALNMIGMWGRDRVVAAINAGFPPPNSPVTVALKGSSLPLVDTGLLKSSITYEINGKFTIGQVLGSALGAASRAAASLTSKQNKRAARKKIREAKRGIKKLAKRARRALK